MKDRLEELKSLVNQGRDFAELDDNLVFDNAAFKDSETNSLQKFFQEVAELSLELTDLKGLSELIDKKQQDVLCCTTEESVFTEKNDLNIMKASFASQAQFIYPKITAIQHELTTDCKYWRVEHRIRQNQLSVLLSRYHAIMSHHFVCEAKYRVRLKEKMLRQAELAGLKLREEDLENMVASSLAPPIVGHDLDILKAKQVLAVAQVRHQQLLDLEYEISELHTIFLQLEILISEQQELVDNIEYNILHTQDYIEQSNETMKKAFKCKCPSRFLMMVSTVAGLCACCTCLSCMTRTLN
ncbi:syntaxin-3-like [Dipodomys spectabilis]|uniref:syntaxin-3-like n=1 Tax=Dipodomys spectabilis TaxID=105255 RepID=UPI001C53E66C|nr:syntaxin-3-like [Dipodomys spectabilis]